MSERTPEIIPAILVHNKEEFERRVALVAPHVGLIQIDVMDGEFVPNLVWADPLEIEKMHLDVPFEAHLMVENPEEAVGAWIAAGARRIIVHAEAKGNIGLAVERIRAAEREAGVAINPPTTVEAIADLLPFVTAVLVMGVTPGASGQAFQETALSKIRELRRRKPDLHLEVDGGVKMGIARRLAAAGADGIVAASVIFDAPDPLRALEELKRDIVL